MPVNFSSLFDSVDVIGLIDLVLGWDLPDEVFPEAFKAHASSLHARFDPDGSWGLRAE